MHYYGYSSLNEKYVVIDLDILDIKKKNSCSILDFEGLKSEIESEKSLQYLKGRKIEIHEVPFCKCILLWGIPIETSQIDIEDALLRIMGPDSIDDIDYSEGAEYAIITFKQTGTGIMLSK